MEKAIRSIFSERESSKVYFEEVGKTQPEFKESCDINYILNKYQKTGQLPLVQRDPIYEDYSEVVDYQEALNIIIEAEQQFSGLDAEVRKKFDNDPAKFLSFVNDEANKEEMYDLGLAHRPVPAAPIEVSVVNPTDTVVNADESPA